jgi:TPR repeat protein
MATHKGREAYLKGNYAEASPFLKKAANHGDLTSQRMYADVCFRDLDGKRRNKMKAAFWYIVTACNGDCDIYSYLQSEDPDICCDEPYVNMNYDERLESRMKRLVDAWELRSKLETKIGV